MKLNLGCNDSLMPGYVGVDVVAPKWATPENFRRIDLSGRRSVWREEPDHWPWEDCCIEEIVAHDVFEHIDNHQFPGWKGIIWCMNEAHRILRPGGILDLKVPCLDFREDGVMIGGMGVFCDPTHVQVWTSDTRYYFDEYWNNPAGERGRLGPGMGITALFKTVGGESYGVKNGEPQWKPVIYNPKYPERRKLIRKLEAVK